MHAARTPTVLKFAFLALCTLALCGCGKRETVAFERAQAGILLVGNSADPATLDPTFATGLTESKILCALFEGLTAADTQTLQVTPAAAKNWEISEDLKTYTFHIDENARWSDGAKLKASDFVFAWRRILSPKLGAEYSSMLFIIKNARAYNAGKLQNAQDLGIRAIDDNTLQVTLEEPTPYFLSMLYHTAFAPLPEHVLKKLNCANARDAAWTLPKNMVSNGPFILEKNLIGDKVLLLRNPLYRDASNVIPNGVAFFPIDNLNTEDRAFEAGQLHITNSVPPQRIDAIKREAPRTLLSKPWLGTYYYLINTRKAPLDNPLLRAALSLAIDRPAIIENFLKGGQSPAYGLVPNGCGGYAGGAYTGFDPAKARALLKEAGYENGKGLPKIRISYNTSEQHRPIAEAVQAMWKKELGIDAELYNLSWPAYLDDRRRGDFEIVRASWIADFDAPENFLSIFESSSGLNHGGFKSAKFDALLAQAARAQNNARRMLLLKEAEETLFESAPLIPLFYYGRVCRVSPLVKNYHVNLLDYQNFKNVGFDVQGGAK